MGSSARAPGASVSPKPETTIATTPDVRINEQIRAPRVRVVDPQGQHGIYSRDEALQLARSRNLDLVEISPNAEPPVCKVIDYGKFRYEQQKKEKEARKNAHAAELKEIRFGPHTDTHDFQFKVKHARTFLEEGDKVRAYVRFQGRAIVYQAHGTDLLNRFIEALSDVAKVDQSPQMEGRRMTIILSPSKTVKKKA